jgi:uncharacterized protein YdiU (UPF0061 family)
MQGISLDIMLGETQGWELQLKGSGKTPFSRSADGQAVLRSHIRFGSFEVFFHQRQFTLLRELAGFVKTHYYPETFLALPLVDNEPEQAVQKAKLALQNYQVEFEQTQYEIYAGRPPEWASSIAVSCSS